MLPPSASPPFSIWERPGGKLFQLRPVTFFYKPQFDDGSRILQYGLIAEEVAKVYPDLVLYGEDGQPANDPLSPADADAAERTAKTK